MIVRPVRPETVKWQRRMRPSAAGEPPSPPKLPTAWEATPAPTVEPPILPRQHPGQAGVHPRLRQHRRGWTGPCLGAAGMQTTVGNSSPGSVLAQSPIPDPHRALGGRQHHTHFTDGETVTQRGERTFSRPQGQWVAESGFEPPSL